MRIHIELSETTGALFELLSTRLGETKAALHRAALRRGLLLILQEDVERERLTQKIQNAERAKGES